MSFLKVLSYSNLKLQCECIPRAQRWQEEESRKRWIVPARRLSSFFFWSRSMAPVDILRFISSIYCLLPFFSFRLLFSYRGSEQEARTARKARR